MANYRVKIDIDARGGQAASAQLSRVDRALNDVGAKSAKFFKDFGGNFAAFTAGDLAANAVRAVGAAALDAGREVLRYSAALEQTQVGFRSIIGNAGMAAGLMKDLKQFSTQTPFDVEGLAKSAQRMLAVGVETGKVIPLMKDLGNIVAATGEVSAERLEGITVAITQMISKTKVSAEEMEQLAERGVPAWRLLSEALGKSQAETRKLAEQGKISSDVMVAALQKMSQQKFGDAMAAQSRTFSGAMAVIQNILKQAAAEWFEPIFDEVRKFAGNFAKNLQSQETRAKGAAFVLGKTMGESWKTGWLSAVRDGIAGGLQLMLEHFTLTGKYFVGDSSTRFGQGFQEGLQSLPTVVPSQQQLLVPGQATPLGSGAFEMAEKARKEAEEREKRDVNARLQRWQNFGQATVAEFERWQEVLREGFARTGNADAYRAEIENLNKWFLTKTTETQKALMALESAQADREKKTAEERALLAEQQKDRAAGWSRQMAEARQNAEQLITEGAQKNTEQRIQLLEAEAARQMALARARTDTELARLEADTRNGAMSEVDLLDWAFRQKLALFDQERKLIAEQLAEAGLTAEQRKDLINKQQILDQELAEATIRNSMNRAEAVENEAKRVVAALNEMGAAAAKNLTAADGGTDGGSAQDKGGGWLGQFMGQIDQATGQVRNWGDVTAQVGKMVTDTFLQMGQALGSMVGQWVLMGDQADMSMKKMVATVLSGVAAQAATLAVFHVAMGVAALTPWGAAMYGPAPLHFKAAALWGAIAVGTALLGRAAAGNSFKSGSASTGESERPDYFTSAPSGSLRGGNVPPQQGGLARQVEGLASAVNGLNDKLSGMRPGDVLTAGAKERRGFLTETVTAELNQNASQVGKFSRAINLR